MDEIKILKDEEKRQMGQIDRPEADTFSAETVDTFKTDAMLSVNQSEEPASESCSYRGPPKKLLMIGIAVLFILGISGGASFLAFSWAKLFFLIVGIKLFQRAENAEGEDNKIKLLVFFAIMTMLFFDVSLSVVGPVFLIGLGIYMLIRNRKETRAANLA